MSRAGLAFATIAFLFVLACQKSSISTSESHTFISSNDTLTNDTLVTDTLSYGDSLFSASVVGSEKRIFPTIKPSQPGRFVASLPGLDLDSITGRINVSKSESGLRYQVYYLSPTNELIASTSVTIAGIDYQDRIYDLSSPAPEDQFALPIFNMTQGLPLPCSNGDPGAICRFDETDINGDNIPDYIGANNSKLIIDTLTGVIDLKNSLAAGVFGPVPPGVSPSILNGRKKDVMIYYRLNDGTTRTLKKITVRLVYFQSKALIPESMQLEIDSRNQRYLLQPGSASSSGSTGDDLLTLAYYYYSTPKRPPLIVIVSGR
jgi:hypothetical protein